MGLQSLGYEVAFHTNKDGHSFTWMMTMVDSLCPASSTHMMLHTVALVTLHDGGGAWPYIDSPPLHSGQYTHDFEAGNLQDISLEGGERMGWVAVSDGGQILSLGEQDQLVVPMVGSSRLQALSHLLPATHNSNL